MSTTLPVTLTLLASIGGIVHATSGSAGDQPDALTSGRREPKRRCQCGRMEGVLRDLGCARRFGAAFGASGRGVGADARRQPRRQVAGQRPCRALATPRSPTRRARSASKADAGGGRRRWRSACSSRPLTRTGTGRSARPNGTSRSTGFAVKDGLLNASSLAPWLERVERLPVPANAKPGAFTPQVYLMTLDSSLDVDKNGIFSRADLDLHFQRADSNKDGALSRDELRATAALGRGGRAAGRPGARRPAARRSGVGRGRASDSSAKPLMPWQRTLADALALQKASGKPLLVCVNDDGESASERLARQYYCDPKWVELAKGFIPLIASPGQRMPRDYDDHGRRIEDKRFGRVLNSEILNGEPELFRRYFNGRRVAPASHRRLGGGEDPLRYLPDEQSRGDHREAPRARQGRRASGAQVRRRRLEEFGCQVPGAAREALSSMVASANGSA